MDALSQKQALAIIPKLTGPLSILGSCSILYDILSDKKRKLKRPYFRIMLVLSFVDIITSFWLFLSTWPIPRGTEGVVYAAGTTETCTAQGFFLQLTLISPFYNLNLSLYYLLLSKYQLTEEEIAKRYERYMHAIALSIGLGFAILGLPLTLYNNANLWCWVASYPTGCEDMTGHHHTDVPCTRGQYAWLFRWLIFYGPLWLIILSVTVSMIMLTRSVKKEEKGVIEQTEFRSHVLNANHLDLETSDVTEEGRCSDTSPTASDVVHRLERSRLIFHQAAFYVVAFYLVWLFPTLSRVYQLITGESSFFLLAMSSLFAPLQGLMNFIVYRHGQIVA